MNLSLLDLHVKSFSEEGWTYVREILKKSKNEGYATKMIYFAPKEIDKALLKDINALEHVHDKSEPLKNITKGEPVCTILFKAFSFSKSYLGALEVVEKIKRIIK
jgi:predicted ATP-grasp superfamily ATP-dependent carboligase